MRRLASLRPRWKWKTKRVKRPVPLLAANANAANATAAEEPVGVVAEAMTAAEAADLENESALELDVLPDETQTAGPPPLAVASAMEDRVGTPEIQVVREIAPEEMDAYFSTAAFTAWPPGAPFDADEAAAWERLGAPGARL